MFYCKKIWKYSTSISNKKGPGKPGLFISVIFLAMGLFLIEQMHALMRIFLLMALFFLTQCVGKEKEEPWVIEGKMPASILAIHADLLKKTSALTLHHDSTGRAALKLRELLIHHFGEEERYLLPVLGLLPGLSKEKIPSDIEGTLRHVDWYKQNTNHLEAEHQFIRALTSELVAAAATDGHQEAAELEAALHQHAAEEDEIIFPAVRVTGLYLEKMRQ